MTPYIVAAAQYRIDCLGSWSAFEDKLADEVAAGIATGASLLVFPEYASMELASLFDDDVRRSLPAQLDALQRLHDDYVALYAGLAQQHGCHLLAGSFPVEVAPRRYHNRAWLLSPDGRRGFQDKLVMTRFEAERWGIAAGEQIRVFDTALGRIAIDICYDIEFPLLARAQVEAGAELLLVPSCTDTEAGYHRVSLGAQARALENQCHVVQSPTVGTAAWSEAVDVNLGAAGFYTPVDSGFPPDGRLALGVREQPGWVAATIDPARASALRSEGQVLNWRDWPRQLPAAARGAEVLSL